MKSDPVRPTLYKAAAAPLRSASAPIQILLLVLTLLVQGCSVFDKDEPLPTYLHIDTFRVVTSIPAEGSNDQDIRDVWLEADGKSIGTFEVPVTVPVLGEGNELDLIMRAGIRNNGRSDNRIAYPFFQVVRDTIARLENALDSVFPVVRYVDGAIFPWLEDFEDRSISMEISGSGVTIDTIGVTADTNLVFRGNNLNEYSAIIDLLTGNQYFECSSINTFSFPRNKPVYLELHYRTDANLQVGLLAYQQNVLQDQIPVLLLYPTEGIWKKVYISLGEDINASIYANMDFKVFFSARNNGSSDHPKILLDNIKVVHQ